MSAFHDKWGNIWRAVRDVAITALRFTAVLVGGITVFLMVAPVFRYLPYSARGRRGGASPDQSRLATFR